MEIIAQEMQGEDSGFDLKYFIKKKEDAYRQYQTKYPSESKKKQVVYYRAPTK
jgi:hypothetical protein